MRKIIVTFGLISGAISSLMMIAVVTRVYRCEPLTDLSYPVVLLQRGESRGDRFIESLRSDLYGVFNVSKILYRNCARSQNHKQKRTRFAFSSPSGVQTSRPSLFGIVTRHHM
jgi:hypothetical protein